MSDRVAVLSSRFDEALLSRVEDAGLNASAPSQQRWLDGWLVRLSPGKAKRARCINALAPGRLPLDQRLALARATYAEAGLPLLIRVTPFSAPQGLDETLAAQGFHPIDDTRVMVSDLEAAPVPATLPPGCELAAADFHTFAELVGSWRGSPPSQRRAHGERLANSPVRCHPHVLYQMGEPVAAGQFTAEADLVGLYDVFTPPAWRGRGLARALCGAMLQRAREAGARVAYLQVESDNDPARAVYAKLGFSDAYSYRYRSDDSSVK